MINFSQNPHDWRGCLPSYCESGIMRSALSEDAKPFAWYPWALPTINQVGPSCVGQAWANWLELMLRRYVSRTIFAPGEQIDGHAVWVRGRELFYSGRLTGGMQLPQGFAAMMDLGILPPESLLVAVNKNWNSVCRQLAISPMVQGHHIHPGWFRADRVSGLIDHEPIPAQADGYHATLLMGTGMHGDRRFRVGQNSWGCDFANNGYFVMTDEEWFEGVMADGPYTVQLPEGWEKWQGWKEHVVKIAA